MEENENKKICYYCGEEITGDDYHYVIIGDKKEIACDNCACDNTFYCDSCNLFYDLEDNNGGYQLHNGDIICQNCYDNDYFTCAHCGEIYNISEECQAPNGDSYCHECFYNNCTYCANCDAVIYMDDASYDEDTDDYYCNDCYNELNDCRIYGYHDFDDWKFYKKDEEINPYYIGFELEIETENFSPENQRNTLDILQDNLNVVFMHDGSLNEHGFEIVSHPQSFEYLQSLKNKYEHAFERAIKNGYISHDSSNCGLHFHFTAPRENRDEIVERIWIILETYKDEIARLSRRRGYFDYCKFLTDTDAIRNKNAKMYYIKKCDKTFERYLALNNRNSHTIEFRFFRGTLNVNTFFADLEFVNNIYNESCNLSKNITDITWHDLIHGEHISNYCNANNILTDKKIVDDSLEYVKIENKMNRLTVNIKNILLKASKRKYLELLENEKNEKNEKIKDFSAYCNKMFIFKEKTCDFYKYLRESRFLFDNINVMNFNDFRYYFNTSDMKDALNYFLSEEEKRTVNQKFEKLKEYYNKIETEVI